jgi:hypothetical protein
MRFELHTDMVARIISAMAMVMAIFMVKVLAVLVLARVR